MPLVTLEFQVVLKEEIEGGAKEKSHYVET